MSTLDEKQFQQRMQRIEALIQEVERSTDLAAQSAARAIVQALLDLHGAGLAKVLELLERSGEPGRASIAEFTRDGLISSLLLLHGLHPLDLESRVQQALEKVRPYLRSHGGSVELLAVADGAVRLRLQGSCHGCPSSALTLKTAIEEAICEAAPDVTFIEVEGVTEPADPPTSRLVSLPLLDGNGVTASVSERRAGVHA